MHIKKIYPLFILFIFCNNFLHSQNRNTSNPFLIKATYTPYTTAMGKGKGIIFRVNISNSMNKSFTVDSFFVNNLPMKFSSKNVSKNTIIECNYLVNSSEPSLNPDGTMNKSLEINDELINKQKFYPSWIVVEQNGKKRKIKIERFSEIKEKVNH